MDKREIAAQLRNACIRAYRGVKPRGARGFATDAGYYGRGLYYSTDRAVARFYANHDDKNVVERCVSFNNPLVIGVGQARRIAMAAGTIDAKGNPRRDWDAVDAAQRLSNRWLAAGYDGVAVVHMKNKHRKVSDVELLDLNPPADLRSHTRRR